MLDRDLAWCLLSEFHYDMPARNLLFFDVGAMNTRWKGTGFRKGDELEI